MLQEIPQIPLPHFPHGHRSAVDQQAQKVLSHLASIFPSTAPSTNGQYERGNIRNLREELAILDGNIHGLVLQAATLRRALDKVIATYDSLKERQRELSSEIKYHTYMAPSPRLPTLPVEIIEMICSLSFAQTFSGSKAVESWGDIIYKSVPLACGLGNLASEKAQKAIKKGGRLHVRFYPNDLDKFLDVSARVPFKLGVWKGVEIVVASMGPQECARMLRCFRFTLTAVERFTISLEHSSQRLLQRLLEAYPEDPCFKDLKLPSRTTIRIPLQLIPWFEGIISGVQHLEVDIGAPQIPKAFISNFEGIDLRNLRSLEIWSNQKSSFYNTPTIGNALVFPNLRRLTFNVIGYEIRLEIIQVILGCIISEQLERLDILCRMDPKAHFDELMIYIGTRYNSLKRLFLHQFNSIGFVSIILSELYETILPNLEYLSIFLDLDNIDEEVVALVELLEYRKGRIHTLELHTGSRSILGYHEQLQIEYLGLFVKNILVIPDIG